MGKKLSDNDVSDIAAFLASLTGPLPKDFAVAPTLPAAAFQGGG